MTARVKTALLVGVLAVTALLTRVATQNERIPGRTPGPVADGRARAVGRLDPKQMLRLTLVLQPPNQDEMQQFLRDVQDQQSPRFHQYLTFDEWKSRYAPSNGEVARVQAWARRAGLNPIHQFRNNLAVKVESDVETIEAAFGIRLNNYEYGTRRFFANDRNPQMPSELAGVLKNVQGLNNYERMRPVNRSFAAPSDDEPIYRGGPFIREETSQKHGRRAAADTGVEGSATTTSTTAQPQICCGDANNLEPGDLFSSDGYDLAALQRFSACCNPTHNPGGSPKETSIAVIGGNSVATSDLQTFVGQYNMAMNVTQVMIDGAGCCNDEMTMDIEYATAFANSFGAYTDTAHVYAYEGGGTGISDILDAWEEADSADMARNATTSFGAYEDIYDDFGNPSISDFTDVINAMAAKGWAIAAASGDHGATDDCATYSVSFPASSPNLVAAGGTTLTLTNNGGVPQFATEVTWNGPGCGGFEWPGQNLGGGGGGCASVEPRPFWQELLPSFCGQKRALPDVSLNASTGQKLYYGNKGGWIYVAGTSIVAPELSGFFAQLNSYLLKLGNICGPAPYTEACAPFGNPASYIWRFGYGGGNTSNGHNPFYDITSGCNGGQNVQGYCARTGYDLATGWGSFNMLQMAWALIDAVTAKTNPEVSFTGPAANSWFNSSKSIDFTIVSDPPSGTTATVKVAGYTAGWDNPIADVTSHATPGSGDSFYTGPATSGATGSLTLSSANEGCHTAHVRGWDNSGRTTSDSTYGPVCFDDKPPTVTCGSPSTSWSAADASIACTASDQAGLSGLADDSPAFFYLSTSVSAGTETANAFTNSRQVCDKAGNCVTAGPIGANKIDKKAPSISITSPTAAEYIIAQPVVASYSCVDGGSGVATCAGPVTSGANVDTVSVGTKTFAVNSTDNVANASSLSTSYTVTYRICLQYDPNTPVNGRGVNISLQLCDYNNANVSQQSIVVTALAVDGIPAKAKPLGSLNPGNVFLYGPEGSPGASYLYVLDSQGLSAGAHVLTFSVAGDPVTHSAPFRIKK